MSDLPAGRRHAEKMLKRMFGPRVAPSVVEIDNPRHDPNHAEHLGNPRRIKAVRNANESPLALMEMRGTLNPSQVAAGLRFRLLYERVMAGTPSPSDLKERVDGGGRPDALGDAKLQAGKDLRRAAERIGPAGYWLVRAVCGDGASLREIARRARSRRPAALTALRWALDELAEAWGLASRGAAAESRAAATLKRSEHPS